MNNEEYDFDNLLAYEMVNKDGSVVLNGPLPGTFRFCDKEVSNDSTMTLLTEDDKYIAQIVDGQIINLLDRKNLVFTTIKL